MNHLLRGMHSTRRPDQASSLVVLIACLLVGVRLVAGVLHEACFYNEFERAATRSFHLHRAGDRNPCHHGKPDSNPLSEWACAVSQDVSAFVLPEIPRLPEVVSVFVPLVLLLVSYRTLFPIAAHGRGPPLRVS